MPPPASATGVTGTVTPSVTARGRVKTEVTAAAAGAARTLVHRGVARGRTMRATVPASFMAPGTRARLHGVP
jgi:hypothetical protein